MADTSFLFALCQLAYEIPDVSPTCSDRISDAWQRLSARVVPLISRDITNGRQDPETSRFWRFRRYPCHRRAQRHYAGINSSVCSSVEGFSRQPQP
jgi:hypothetical protein